MTLSDFLNGLHICFSLFTFFTLSLCWHSVHVAQKNVTCCTKSFVVSTKNISDRSYAAHQNYVSHRKISYGNKKQIVTSKSETHLTKCLVLHRKGIHVGKNCSCDICCMYYKRFVSQKKYFDVIQKFKLGFINLINFCQNGSSYFSSPKTRNDYWS